MILARISEKNEDFESAYEYQDIFVKIRDSLNTAKETNEIQKLKLNFKLNKTEQELAYISQKNSYLNTIYILVLVAVLLLIFLVSRQLKVVKMTKEIHEVQTRLIKEELDKRESTHASLTSSFDVTTAQDNERKSADKS